MSLCAITTTVGVGVRIGERVDGVPVVKGDAVLLTAQTDSTENGLYVASEGRSVVPLYDGMQVYVMQGDLCAGWVFVCTSASACVFRPQMAPGPVLVTPDATEGRLVTVPEGRQMRTLSVQGWTDLLRVVPRGHIFFRRR